MTCIISTRRIICGDVSIKNDAHSGKNANLSIDAQNATDNTPLSGAKIKQNEEKTGLFNLGYSPLSTIMIENCLVYLLLLFRSAKHSLN
jgi:hypothetical protein